MNTVTIGVSSVDETKKRIGRACLGEKEGAFIGFANLEVLWKALTPKRWEILSAMAVAGPLAIRDVARRANRDVKSVHGDMQALIKASVLARADDGRIVLSHDEIHMNSVVRAALGTSTPPPGRR
jgi:predicted transcriptional regulator